LKKVVAKAPRRPFGHLGKRKDYPMAYLRNLPDNATLLDLFRRFPSTAGPLLDYHEALLRGPSPLCPSERELIAAYVSAVNSCGYCHGVHEATAAEFGMPAGMVEGLLSDVDTAPVSDKLKPILRFVRKLTLAPSTITQHDADAVYAEGWEEQALYDATSVCALFNLMNRLVEGTGIKANPGYSNVAAKRLHALGYAALKGLLR
jgi:uncharacterized peroxidase-related enzyme